MLVKYFLNKTALSVCLKQKQLQLTKRLALLTQNLLTKNIFAIGKPLIM